MSNLRCISKAIFTLLKALLILTLRLTCTLILPLPGHPSGDGVSALTHLLGFAKTLLGFAKILLGFAKILLRTLFLALYLVLKALKTLLLWMVAFIVAVTSAPGYDGWIGGLAIVFCPSIWVTNSLFFLGWG